MKRYTWRQIAVSSSLTASELPIDWRNAVADYVTGAMTDVAAPGAAVVIVDSGGVLFSEGFGVTARGGDPVTPLTPFYLASVSKALTGLAVMQLIEGGRLDLNTHSGDPASGWVGRNFRPPK